MYGEILCILIGAVIGILATVVLTSKGEPADENGNGGEYEGYPDLTGTQQLSALSVEKSTWKNMALHSYFLKGNSYQLDEVNLTIDMGPKQRWHGVNQCLFYMSDEAIPNKPELYEIRTSCNNNLRPWDVKEALIKKKTGRYLVIGFTNNHDFIASGEIKIVQK